MGVPAFFRWLSRKYPSIVVHAVEEKGPLGEDGHRGRVDCTKPNPNDVEFDNLYLDMNGIIHPCCHPEDKPAPKNEDEMMVAIFEYMDRIFAICRPRKLLYMAIDGVAPRAKMNQQRSRRFRASQETATKHEELSKIRGELASKGVVLPPEKPAAEKFDSNCITPGTPFMFRLAECLRYYVHDRLNNDPAWKNLKVILSDANMPGEGEHKIMDFIRKQRGQPHHDPNTKHCLCGADADLIMLGLATHEPNFTIIREEFKPGQPRACEICGQVGHEAKECTGQPKQKSGKFDEIEMPVASEVDFIFIRLNVLREYLQRDLLFPTQGFVYDFERVLDDWVFMCFFVGNDFLPHLPSLEIREGAIDRLVKIYKDTLQRTGGYLAKAGEVNLNRVQVILNALGEVEDEIFKNRRQDELRFQQRKKNEKQRAKQQQQQGWQAAQRPPALMSGPGMPYKPGHGQDVKYTKDAAASMRVGDVNRQAANDLRAMLYKDGEKQASSNKSDSQSAGIKRPHGDEDESEPEPEDDVKLWEDGWKSRYYENKFGVDTDDIEFRHKVARAYARGLCWVLRYYFQGCASWDWYFPYHYAPFASDFVNVGDLPNDFEKDTKPFRPFEQLMSVFPAASKEHIPPTWRPLMYEPDSPIIDFYPTNFRIDLNGKKWAWMGVALLPFVDEKRLLAVLESKYADLTPEELKRSQKGSDRLFVSKWHAAFDFIVDVYGCDDDEAVELSTRLTQGMLGMIKKDDFVILPGGTVRSPIPLCDDIKANKAIMVKYEDPKYPPDHVYPAVLLPNAQMPPPTLKGEGLQMDNRGNYRPQLGFQPNSGYRTGKDPSAARRMVGASIHAANAGRNPGSTVAPPSSYGNDRINYRGGRQGPVGFGQGSRGPHGGEYNTRPQSAGVGYNHRPPPVHTSQSHYSSGGYSSNASPKRAQLYSQPASDPYHHQPSAPVITSYRTSTGGAGGASNHCPQVPSQTPALSRYTQANPYGQLARPVNQQQQYGQQQYGQQQYGQQQYGQQQYGQQQRFHHQANTEPRQRR